MPQDNSLGPPEKSNLEKLVDSTPAYKVMGCLLIVGLVWGFIQEWFILGGGDPLSFSLLFFYLGRLCCYNKQHNF